MKRIVEYCVSLKEAFRVEFLRQVEEAEREEFRVSKKTKLLLAFIFCSPLVIQLFFIVIDRPDIGYWMFLPNVCIIIFLIIRGYYDKFMLC